MMRNLLVSGLLIVVLGISACSQKTAYKGSLPLIPRDSMICLMADMEFTEAALKFQQRSSNNDSIKRLVNRSYDSLYSWYNYSPEQFELSLGYYQNNLVDFQKMLDEVILQLTRERDSVQYLSKKVADTLSSKVIE